MNNELNPNFWVDNYSNALFAFVLKRVSNVTLAEDIVQDVFLNAWRSRDTFNGTSSEKTWLYTICKNKIVDYYRKASVGKHVYSINDAETDIYFVEDGHWDTSAKPSDWHITNDRSIDEKEFFSILQQCKQKLKAIQQQVFTMKYLDEIDTDEICELLGITNQNYWVLIHRAKIQLRTCLQKNWINL